MDSRQHHLSESPFLEPLEAMDNPKEVEASAPPPRPGNDAIGAGSVAPVLDLQKGSGVSGKSIDVSIPDFFLPRNIPYADHRARARAGISQEVPNRGLFPVSQDQAYSLYLADLFRIDLGVATRDHDEGRWVEAMGPPDELSGLEVRPVGDGAGIDDVDIGRLRERDELKSAPLEGGAHNLGVELVCLASQGGDGYGFGHWCSTR